MLKSSSFQYNTFKVRFVSASLSEFAEACLPVLRPAEIPINITLRLTSMAFCKKFCFKNKTSTPFLFKRLFACVELSIEVKAYHLTTVLLIISLINTGVTPCIKNITYNYRAAFQSKVDTESRRIYGGKYDFNGG
jgi:hypothetical protein